MENELENLKKIHQQDIDIISALSDEIEELKSELEGSKKLHELHSKREEIDDKISDEEYRIFMNTDHTPLVDDEIKEKEKLNALHYKKQEIEDEIAKESYRVFMNTVRKPLVDDETEEPVSRSLDEILLEED